MAKRVSLKAPKVAEPAKVRFREQSKLTRYVRDVQRLTRRRPAPDTFIRNPGDSHLSVNLVGIESVAEIANHYREQFQDGVRRVAVCIQKVREYNKACNETPVALRRCTDGIQWEFLDRDGTPAPAYCVGQTIHRHTAEWSMFGFLMSLRREDLLSGCVGTRLNGIKSA
jgi:hypothetical protein